MIRRTCPVLVALAVLGCANETDRTWRRQQDCLERAERFVESIRRQLEGSSTTLGTWQTHYSAKAERCYSLLEELHNYTVGLPIGAPYRQERIFDASERREIARFTRDGGNSGVWDEWCQQIPDNSARPTTCKGVAALADDLMKE